MINMRSRGRLLQFMSQRVVLLTLPLTVNLAVYFGIVQPMQARVTTLHQAQTLNKLKPALESTLTESDRILAVLRSTGFSTNDPSAVMQRLQELANTHRVHITTLNSGAQMATGASSTSFELQVSGRFGRLARWMGDLETQSGCRIEEWDLSRSGQAQDLQQLTIRLTALSRSGS